MTSKEHIEEAERLVARAREEDIDSPFRGTLLAEAQVHATLALATRPGASISVPVR